MPQFPPPHPTRSALRLAVRLTLVAIGSFGAGATRGADTLGPETVDFTPFTLADLQRDFDQLRTLATSRHPQLYTDRTALENAFAIERARLREGMNELEFFRLLRGLVQRLNCGHTSLQLSSATDATVNARRRLLPLAIKSIDGRFFVTKTLPGASFPAGAEILEINGRSASAILQQMFDLLPADGANLTLKLHAINQHFSRHYHLLVDTSSEFSLVYLDPTTRTPTTALLAGVSSDEWAQLHAPAPPDNGGLGSTAFAADHATLFVKTFFYYDPAARSRFNAFVDAFFNEVAARKIPHVLLDLRGNGGGDPYCGAYLFARLIDRPLPYFSADTPFYPDLKNPVAPAANAFAGSLLVLVDGGCFSTTGHFTSLLRFHGIGRFVGEETGGSFACTSNNLDATLERTRLRFSYATNTFTTAVSGLTPGRGILPHYPLTPTAEDHRDGRDRVKEFALSLVGTTPPALVVTRHPASMTAASGRSAFFSAQAGGAGGDVAYQWQLDGAAIPAATTPRLVIDAVGLAHVGLYSAVVTAGGVSQHTRPAILGFASAEKSTGGTEVGSDIRHPNTNLYDQVLLEHAFAAITADPGQITRLSYVDLEDDIVQVEFSGAGTLSLALDAASGPASPSLYVQPGVNYFKGHARIVIQGADETTNVSVFSVGRANAVDQTLFRSDVAYDGWADLASLAILSSNGKFGGVFTGNARYLGLRGPIGLYAPDIEFTGSLNIGDLHADQEARPVLILGAADQVRITGGDLEQLNEQPVQVGGFEELHFVAGADSHGGAHAAKNNRARLERDGADVTAAIVVNTAP